MSIDNLPEDSPRGIVEGTPDYPVSPSRLKTSETSQATSRWLGRALRRVHRNSLNLLLLASMVGSAVSSVIHLPDIAEAKKSDKGSSVQPGKMPSQDALSSVEKANNYEQISPIHVTFVDSLDRNMDCLADNARFGIPPNTLPDYPTLRVGTIDCSTGGTVIYRDQPYLALYKDDTNLTGAGAAVAGVAVNVAADYSHKAVLIADPIDGRKYVVYIERRQDVNNPTDFSKRRRLARNGSFPVLIVDGRYIPLWYEEVGPKTYLVMRLDSTINPQQNGEQRVLLNGQGDEDGEWEKVEEPTPSPTPRPSQTPSPTPSATTEPTRPSGEITTPTPTPSPEPSPVLKRAMLPLIMKPRKRREEVRKPYQKRRRIKRS